MKLLAFTILGSGLLLGAAAFAQNPAKVVTRDELRACMNSEADLAARRESMQARSAEQRQENETIRAAAAELADEQKRSEADSRRVDRFQRHVKEHNARVAAARAKDEAFRADLESMNQAVVAHNERCGGIAYNPDDKEAILKERASGAK